MDFDLWTLDSGFWFLEFRSRFPHSPKSKVLGLWGMDFAFSVLSFGLWALGFGFKIWDFTFYICVFGFLDCAIGFLYFWHWALDGSFRF